MIAVVDYGMGNLRSVQKALESVGLDASLTSDSAFVKSADAVVLPGVGAFRDCMDNLRRLELEDSVKSFIKAGKPFLGICLGLQVLLSTSEEFGLTEGLGLMGGRVVEFEKGMKDDATGEILRVPHMGWNQIQIREHSPLFKGIKENEFFYFVHSYYVKPEDADLVSSVTDYGIEFVSSVWKDNVVATQFHPEKSQKAGLKVLENFGKWIKKC